jgi:hypothetical protein
MDFLDQTLRRDLGFNVGRIFHDHVRHGFLLRCSLTAWAVFNMVMIERPSGINSIPLVPAKAGTQIRH